MARTTKNAPTTLPTHGRVQVRNTIAWQEFEGNESYAKHRSYVKRSLSEVESDKHGVTAQARIGRHTYLVLLIPGTDKFVPTDIVDTLVASS